MKYTEKQVDTLLSLPQHLQVTLKALIAIGQASATQISQITGRARAVESAYLNQLVNMGILRKSRDGHTALFEEATEN